VGKKKYTCEPEWFLGSSKITNYVPLEILGTIFTKGHDCYNLIKHRVSKRKLYFYSLSESRMTYAVVVPNVKLYLWKSVCFTVLRYVTGVRRLKFISF
jgi:hypothetical protein